MKKLNEQSPLLDDSVFTPITIFPRVQRSKSEPLNTKPNKDVDGIRIPEQLSPQSVHRIAVLKQEYEPEEITKCSI